MDHLRAEDVYFSSQLSRDVNPSYSKRAGGVYGGRSLSLRLQCALQQEAETVAEIRNGSNLQRTTLHGLCLHPRLYQSKITQPPEKYTKYMDLIVDSLESDCNYIVHAYISTQD